MENIKWIDLKPSNSEKAFIDYQNYLIKVMCAVYGVPACYIKGYKETKWQKIRRSAKLLIYKIGLRLKKKKKSKSFTSESWREIMMWREISQKLKYWINGR